MSSDLSKSPNPVVRRPVVFWLIVAAALAGLGVGVREIGAWMFGGSPAAHTARTPPAKLPPGQALSGRAQVVDGDRLDVAGARVRLFGIAAPDLRQTCTNGDGHEYWCGRDSARALAVLIGSNDISCKPPERGRYAQDVALCIVHGRDLSEAMLRAGQAILTVRYSDGLYAAAQRDAQGAKRGLWAGPFETPGEWRHHHPGK